MVSELERKVRELDDPNLKGKISAIRIKEGLGDNTSLKTVYQYIIAKRKGFDSCEKYKDFFAQRKGFLNDYEADKYNRLKKEGRVKNKKEFFKRTNNNGELEYHPTEELDKLESKLPSHLELSESREYSEIIRKVLDQLDNRLKFVIICRFYEEMTLEEIGEQLNQTHEKVRRLESKALKRLPYLLKRKGIYG